MITMPYLLAHRTALGVLCLAVVAAGAEIERAPANAWPLHRGTLTQTGVSAADLPSNLTLLWKQELVGGPGLAPAVADGVVYVGTDDGKLFALQLSDGQRKWEFRQEDAILAPPTVMGDYVFVGDEGGNLWAVRTRDGRDDWSFKSDGAIYSGAVPLPVRAALAPQVLVGSYDGGLYCIRTTDGELLWTYKTADKLHGTPAVAGEFAFVAGCDGFLHCVRHRDGALLAKFNFKAPSASAAAFANDRFFLGTYGNQVVAIEFDAARAATAPAILPAASQPGTSPTASGPAVAEGWSAAGLMKTAWTFEDADRQFPFMSSAATNGESVVIGGRDKRVWCLNAADGRPRWSYAARKRFETSAIISGDRAFIGGDDGVVYALSLSDGSVVWQYESGSPIVCGPIAADGRLIFANADGTIFCFGAPAPAEPRP